MPGVTHTTDEYFSVVQDAYNEQLPLFISRTESQARDRLVKITEGFTNLGFTVTSESGVHKVETGTEDDKTSLPQAKQRRLTYVATLEVLPQ